MENIKSELHRLEQNLTSFLTKINTLQNENKALKKQLYEALEEADKLKKKNEELENKNINLQITRTLRGGKSEHKELKQRLDSLIKEVDECITTLSGKDGVAE
jgi:uncharacterized coiled-coil DUF342 family protein